MKLRPDAGESGDLILRRTSHWQFRDAIIETYRTEDHRLDLDLFFAAEICSP